MGRGKDRAEARAAVEARLAPRKWIKGPRCAQDYADVITRCLDTAAHHIIMAGEQLIDAKGKLEHGEWLRMFRDHETPVDRPLPFGARTGQMLMKIAAHPVLSDANHGSRLPTSWRTLYELARLPEPVLERAIAEGMVHPGLERNGVAALYSHYQTHEPVVISTDADSRAAQNFEQLREAVLTRPAIAQRWAALQAAEQEVETLTKQLVALREHTRRERQRLDAKILATIEAEHGPITFRSVWLTGQSAGHEEILPREKVAGVSGVPHVVEKLPEEQYRCTSCDERLSSGEVIEVRECPHCEERFDGANGRNCPSCNRPFSRLITEAGCPDCLGEDGDVVLVDDEEPCRVGDRARSRGVIAASARAARGIGHAASYRRTGRA